MIFFAAARPGHPGAGRENAFADCGRCSSDTALRCGADRGSLPAGPSVSTTGKTFPSAAEARTADGNKLAEQQCGSIGTVTQTGREDPVAETILTVADFSPNRINGVYDNKMYLNHLIGRRMYGDAGA